MTSALARQTALVLVEKLPEDYYYFKDIEHEFAPMPKRKKVAELWQCFHINQGLRVVQQPQSQICVYPYTVVDRSGWHMPKSETYQLDRAIAYCNSCIRDIPEFSQLCFIPNTLSPDRKKQIENKIGFIIAMLDHGFPELEELERV
jgi:hypothetical protein